jgi:hypothetical protein
MRQSVSFWEFTKQSAASATRQFFAPYYTREAVSGALSEKVGEYSIRVVVPVAHAERVGKEIDEFLTAQCNNTPGYVSRLSYKEEEV